MKAKIITALFAVVTLIGCKKDDDTPKVYAEENPLNSYLVNSGFDQKTANFINAGNYEFGYLFKPKVKGKINAITFKIPDNATNIRVTIWDATSKAILRTIVIPSAAANTEVKQSIDALSIDPSQKYGITYNGNDWYKRFRNDSGSTPYPIEAGNISILGYNWIYGSSQTFPLTSSTDYYGGDLSFVFQQTE